MQPVIQAQGLHKSYGQKKALDNVNLSIPQGKIVGLIGPNGAGKTTLLKGILGLMPLGGELQVLGKNPVRNRIALLEEVSFIADTTTLPGWLTVAQAITYVAGVHPNFSREKARGFLAKTNILSNSKIKTLSKGMVTQLHLALIMAIDSKLLVLDEPTLGLDIMYRKQFYESLLNDYHSPERTIFITTHQVEEIEDILTDLLFINQGRILLQTSMEDLPNRFIEVQLAADKKDHALAMQPLHMRSVVGGFAAIYENPNTAQLAPLGNLSTPSVADLFVAMVTHGDKTESRAVA